MTTRQGRRLHVDPHDARAHELVSSAGAFNIGSSVLWDAVLGLREWDIVMDIGANYGEMTLGARLPDGARVIAYEPNPRIAGYLRRSVQESGLAVELREVAIGARPGRAAFVRDTVWSGRSGLASTHRTDADHPLETIEVAVRTLDSEIGDDASSSVCIKVDVEGGELDILDGASDLFASGRPWAMMIEILHLDGFEKARLAADFRMLVMDRRSQRFVRVPPTSARDVSDLVGSGWVHGQDAVLTSRQGA